MSSQAHITAPQSAFGRPRWGGSTTALLSVSIGLGILTAAGISLLAQWQLPENDRSWWVLVVAIMAVTVMPACGLWWALFVDRNTLRGATPNPEESIEAQWYTKAASAAFTLCIAGIGVGAAVFSITGWNLDSGLLLIGVFVLMILCFAVSYLVIRRQES